jgi:hypothetical protein
MFRIFWIMPPPHVLEHSPDASQSWVISQWIGQGPGLHSCELESRGQVSPPCCGGMVTVRLCCCVPVPQVVLHSLQGPQAETVQSIGHGCSLHAVDFEVSPAQATPPWSL